MAMYNEIDARRMDQYNACIRSSTLVESVRERLAAGEPWRRVIRGFVRASRYLPRYLAADARKQVRSMLRQG